MNNFLNNKIIKEDLENIYSTNLNWEKLRNKTIFITGPYGMLASYIVFYLIYLNEFYGFNINIIAAGRNKNKLEKRFGSFINKKYFHFYLKDINEPITYESNVDYIIHGASLASPQYYKVIPVEVLKPNVIGTYNLLEFAKEKNVKGFLFFSTGDIYGYVSGKNLITEEDYGIVDPLNIHSCYNESKRIGETMCNSWNYQYNIPTKIARIFHSYGPTMDIENDPRVFASFVKNIINNENIKMKSDGLAKRSFCYISDTTIGFFKILFDGENSEAYNLCNSEEFLSIMDLANVMVNLYPEKNLKVIKVKRNKNDKYLENKVNNIVPSNNKLKELGWNPKVNVKDGFKRVIESKLM